MKLHEEFKLYENMWDDSDATVTLGKTVIDFTTVTNKNQLDEVLDDYYYDSDNNLTYNEYVNQFVPSLLNNPAVPDWAKELFKSSTDIKSIMMAGGDATDDIVAACYQALEDCGYSEDECDMDDISEFIADQAVYGFYIEGNILYVYLSCAEVNLSLDFVQDHLGLQK
jgi:hypothetical protein